MSTTIDFAGAAIYFAPANHVNAPLWGAFMQDQKTAAIAQAKRQLSRHLQTDIEAEDTDADEWYQPDYAVYEQALHILLKSDAIPNGDQNGPKHISTQNDSEAPRATPLGLISSEALRWLCITPGTVRVMRG